MPAGDAGITILRANPGKEPIPGIFLTMLEVCKSGVVTLFKF